MTSLRLGSYTFSLQPGVALGAAYVVVYVALDWISNIDPLVPLGITPWNPPPGLSLFLLLRFGLRMAPWLFVAALSAEVLVRGAPAPWPFTVAACALLAAGYTLVVVLLRRRLRFHDEFATLRDATVFTGTVVAVTFVIAVLYIALFVTSGMLPASSFVRGVAQFWIGDLIGVVVTTPALLVATRGRQNDVHVMWWETLLQVGAIVIALWIIFGSGLGSELKLFYVLFLPLIWIAMRRGLAGTTAAALLVQIGLIAALLFVGHKPGEVLEFQFLMLALALTGLFLGVTVEERRAAEQRLRAKQFELDRSLRAAAASELATTLAHELNQPLSAVASYSRAAQLLLERGDPRQELSATMNKVVAQANRAATVVRRLREFVLTGAIRRAPVAVADLLESVVETSRAHAQRYDVQLTTNSPPGLPPVFGDRVQLETVMHNLVANAIDALKANPGTRTIRLSAAPHRDNMVRLCVDDNGPGVPSEIAGTLFQPLATSKRHGLGLGLAISRTIIEAHGGRLWLEAEKHGASFCLTLPIAP